MNELKKGSKGGEVKKWQTFLNQQGFNVGNVDGDFGKKTYNATIEFQKYYNLTADGIVGQNTFDKAIELGYEYTPLQEVGNFTEELKKEYEDLFNTCEINVDKISEINNIINKILDNEQRYKNVAKPLGIPWQFIAAIHNMESSLNFKTHLHNGDSLQHRTIHVPAGRPASGTPPFTWEYSATDALKLKKIDQWTEWDIAGMLFKLEEYNGWGYRKNHPQVLSPYLWSYTNHYKSGKYIADGHWSDSAVSQQCGAAAILKKLLSSEIVQPVVQEESFDLISPELIKYNWIKNELVLDKVYQKGDKGNEVKVIQEWLEFNKLGLSLDGDFGPITEKVVIEFQKEKNLTADGKVNQETFNELIKPALRALTPIEPANKSYGELVVAYAKKHLEENPVEIGGNNKGPWVRMYMKGNQGGDYPWCAGFATFILKQASDYSDYKMPVNPTFSCDNLAEEGKDKNLFVEGSKIANGIIDYALMPPGSIFLVKKSSGDWTHTGIVIEFDSDGVKTIEGNTNDEGSREGFEVCLRHRSYKSLDFIKTE